MIYCAPYILPVDTEPLLDGAVVVEQDRIVAVGPRELICSTYSSHETVEFPQHILMPGLVNCHTHLELSALANKIPPGLAFSDWLRKVIELRSLWRGDELKTSIQQGIKRIIASGTTCVGDISTSGLSKKLLEEAGLRGIVFLEAISFQPERAEFVLAQLEARLVEFSLAGGRVQVGIAPHAPYSVSPALFRQTADMVTACPDDVYKMTVHLAESQEEELFLSNGSGPLRRLLEWRGSMDETWQPPGCSAVQYLHRLQALPPKLLAVHLNYLQPEDYPLLAQQQVQVVTCPGSNAWLGHNNPHLQALRRQGLNLALGSDSLASNDDLNLFKEMRTLARQNPWLQFDELIQIATLGGAKALGLEGQVGSLTPGKQADMIAVAAPLHLAGNKLAQYVVREVKQAEMIMVAGELPKSTA